MSDKLTVTIRMQADHQSIWVEFQIHNMTHWSSDMNKWMRMSFARTGMYGVHSKRRLWKLEDSRGYVESQMNFTKVQLKCLEDIILINSARKIDLKFENQLYTTRAVVDTIKLIAYYLKAEERLGGIKALLIDKNETAN